MGRSATYAEELLVAEVTRLRQELSLAEEGLANYEEENETLKAEIQYVRQRCLSLAYLLYPCGRDGVDRPREAVAGDIGSREPQAPPHK